MAISEQHKLKKTNKGKNVFSFIVAFIILLCFYPYEFYSAYLLTPTNLSSSLYISMIVIVVGLTFILQNRKPDIPYWFYALVCLQCLGYIICSYAKGYGLPTGPLMIAVLAVVLVIFLSSTCGLYGFFYKYNRWILLMAAMGTVALVLVWAGAINPIMPFIDLSDEDIMFNYGITFSQRNEADAFQYCGFFDEPGAIASWGFYALLFNRFFIKDKIIEKILMLLLIATFSLGYYIQLVAYLLLFVYFNKSKGNRRNWSGALILFAAIAIIIVVFNSFQGTKYDVIYKNTIERAMTTFEDSHKGGGLAVGDREDLTLTALSEFENNPLFGTTKKEIELGNNIYEPLARFGIIGAFFLYIPFLFILIESLRRGDRDLFKCFVVLVLGFTHRPFHDNLLSFFIIYSFLIMYYQQSKIVMKTR